ncbi:beta-lactamase-like protein [Colletotrichum truncatum]|uniref:Beta-lactamase-like protein n=1 Tax=Colletotrichum truncatum TaxID=5467 RepID=A0ACC3Z6C2_COLTU|nr:beta-lactamase-like protein [Colletotrichum truncatum]KAF6788086.1 beta-lactamase-like protein [Colletotrichum truncatum]
MGINAKILETGTIRIRPSHRYQTANKPIWLRRLSVALDRSWTIPLPINTYLIEHPEGYILFDSGESPRTMEPGYFPIWMPFYHLAVDIHVREHEGIGARLAQNNLRPEDLKAVVLSHLHHDHGDGLPDLIGPPIYITSEHWDAYKSPFHATMEGAVPGQWPKGFAPEIIEPTGGPIGLWNRSYPITKDGKVVAIDTPGHVPGHLSLIVYGEDVTYLLLGDATYDQDLLDQELTDGVNSNPHLAIESLRKVKEFSKQRSVVLLPAHDPKAAWRLKNKIVYKPGLSSRDVEPASTGIFGLLLSFLTFFAFLIALFRRVRN